ncbi:hypothetical protein [Spiroplasma culicicola]|uniref:Transmembrane protein n=1 Tax=Spiroplasma culicicola AES-1 TaxID=1276246 RepID=W6A6K2_9MOLU|nr:hypothetical protein [Spiroplasma culicicola]AHI52632.1 hypothetical protein SCULI_v1c02910 [Spiroplasma culicicola AES-1]
MTKIALLSWSNDGMLAEASNLLIMLITGLAAVVIPSIYTYVLLFRYKKSTDKKLANKWFITLILGLQFASLISVVLGWMFLFGEFILPGNDGADLAQILCITFIVLTYSFTATWYLLMFLVPQYCFIIFEEDKIGILGAFIKNEKIIKIIDDEKTKRVYINYLEGRTTLKKLSISKSLVLGQFFVETAPEFGLKIEQTNQLDFFKEKLKEIKLGSTNQPKAEVKETKNKEDSQSKEA